MDTIFFEVTSYTGTKMMIRKDAVSAFSQNNESGGAYVWLYGNDFMFSVNESYDDIYVHFSR